MKHFAVSFLPDARSISVHAGATLLDAAQQAGIILNAVCGGKGTCGKCVVQVAGREVLACQERVDRNLEIRIPEGSRYYRQRILHEGIDHGAAVNPLYCKFLATDGDTDITAAVRPYAGAMRVEVRPQAAESAPAATGDRPCTVTCHLPAADRLEVIAVEPGDTTDCLYGVAVDIGTTTVVAKCVDLRTGKVAATASAANPQIAWGDDVVSRITIGQSEKGLDRLHRSIVDCINSLLAEMCRELRIEPDCLLELVAAGNTTMSHLLLRFPVEQLGQAPYRPHSVDAQNRTPADLGVRIHPQGNIHVMQNIAGFLGSDTLAVGLAVGMDEVDQMTLVVDIGTNGELILGTRERMFSASCAAGPALEGARIRQGGRAVDGAIEAVIVANGDIDLDVIGGGPARSICGSGLIDAAAVLLDLDVMDATGRLMAREAAPADLSDAIRERLVSVDGQPAFVLANGPESADRVILTQKDLRELQLAKGAIRAGIELLLRKAGIGADGIEQILLAGAFGNYIRRESAIRIGLLPNVPVERVRFVGNAASSGAQMALISRTCRQRLADLAHRIEYVEIAHQTDFQMAFAEAMLF